MSKEDIFASTVQKTNLLLKDIEKELDWIDKKNDAYSLLKAVIQTLRDRLTIEEAVDFGAQLPMLLRGIFYEGWRPSRVPVKFDRAEFIGEIERRFPSDPDLPTEEMIQTVLIALGRYITKGEMDDVKNMLPKDFRILFPE